MYPSCYRYWIEAEISPGVWDTGPIFKAGVSTLDEAERKIDELRKRPEPWSYRIVTFDGRPLATA